MRIFGVWECRGLGISRTVGKMGSLTGDAPGFWMSVTWSAAGFGNGDNVKPFQTLGFLVQPLGLLRLPMARG